MSVVDLPPATGTVVARSGRIRVQRAIWRKLYQLRLVLVDRHKYRHVVLEHVVGVPVVVLPEVFNPKLLRSGEFLAEQLGGLRADSRVLELGSGAGAASIAAARYGARVTAVDINPAAVRCTRLNALLNDVPIDVRHGDLFAPVHAERFDTILFNPPYYRGAPRDALDHAWRATDVIERFAAELGDHLVPGGQALVVLSSDGEQAAFLHALRRHGFVSAAIAKRDYRNELMTVYRLRPC